MEATKCRAPCQFNRVNTVLTPHEVCEGRERHGNVIDTLDRRTADSHVQLLEAVPTHCPPNSSLLGRAEFSLGQDTRGFDFNQTSEASGPAEHRWYRCVRGGLVQFPSSWRNTRRNRARPVAQCFRAYKKLHHTLRRMLLIHVEMCMCPIVSR